MDFLEQAKQLREQMGQGAKAARRADRKWTRKALKTKRLRVLEHSPENIKLRILQEANRIMGKVGGIEGPARFSHEDILTLCRAAALLSGWKLVPDRGELCSQDTGYPDLIIARREQGRAVISVLEIKPSHVGAGELRRGIGQCVFYQLGDRKSYLVFPEKWHPLLLRADYYLGNIGLIIYNNQGDLKVVRGDNIFSENGSYGYDSLNLPIISPLLAEGARLQEEVLREETLKEAIQKEKPYIEKLQRGKNPKDGIQLPFSGNRLFMLISDYRKSFRIQDLGLSNRAVINLHRSGCTTVDDLLLLDMIEFKSRRNVGVKISAEVYAKQQEIKDEYLIPELPNRFPDWDENREEIQGG